MTHTCPGFRFAGIHCGIKDGKTLDLGLMMCESDATAAAVFTRNRVCAAPVKLSRSALSRSGGVARAVIVNSGNANACTGPRGMADAKHMAAQTAAALGVPRDRVLVASTGVIGAPLPMDRIAPGIERAATELRAGGFSRFSRAILTTDRGPKLSRRGLRIGDRRIAVIGCTKGAGMIAPNMATTLSFVATDARIRAELLSELLSEAVEHTFNAMTVDGDTSTNDMILVMAGGTAGRALSRRDAVAFGDALRELLDELARKLMRDGEGVHHVVTVTVKGARSRDQARKVARTIANSPLVKTAIAGRDPNWGRILAAAGRAGVPLSERRVSLWIGGVPIIAGGVPAGGASAERRAGSAMKRREYEMVLDLGSGAETAHYLACDLSREYVSINADYRT